MRAGEQTICIRTGWPAHANIPEPIVGRVDHPHRAVHRHVSLATLAEPVLQQDFHPLPHAVRERDARPKLCRRPSAATTTAAAPAAACAPSTSTAVPGGSPNDVEWSIGVALMPTAKCTS